jgi:hypothetical protein
MVFAKAGCPAPYLLRQADKVKCQLGYDGLSSVEARIMLREVVE